MNRAVIIGSSITGITTAKVLSKYVKEVIVIERGELPLHPKLRKGASPQSVHAHGLLNKGYEIINKFLPQTTELITNLGGLHMDFNAHLWWFQKGRWYKRVPTGLMSYSLSRPLLEWALFTQTKDIKNVKFIEKSIVDEYLYNIENNSIIGVSYHNSDSGDETILDCDLLVDASGRGSKTPEHLENMGFDRVQVQKVDVGIKYVTRYYEKPINSEFVGMITFFNAPKTSRLGVFLAAEDKFILSLGGVKGDHPPKDEEGYMEFMKNLDDDSIYQIVKNLKPTSELMSFNFSGSQWREYHKLKKMPRGLLVLGDAFSSFNPIYGQGMSIALAQVEILDDVLHKNSNDLDNIQKKFFKKAAKQIDIAWKLSTAEDMRFDWVNAPRPFGLSGLHWFSDRIAGANHDKKVCKTFFEVLNFKKSISSFMKPTFLLRVLWKNLFKSDVQGPNIDLLINQCHTPLKSKEQISST